jgi:hypothetical protein
MMKMQIDPIGYNSLSEVGLEDECDDPTAFLKAESDRSLLAVLS